MAKVFLCTLFSRLPGEFAYHYLALITTRYPTLHQRDGEPRGNMKRGTEDNPVARMEGFSPQILHLLSFWPMSHILGVRGTGSAFGGHQPCPGQVSQFPVRLWLSLSGWDFGFHPQHHQ